MEIPGLPSSRKIIGQIIFLIRSLANLTHIVSSGQHTHHSNPGPPSRWSIRRSIQPTLLHSRNHRKAEHPRARALRPRLIMVDQLPPHPILALVLQRHSPCRLAPPAQSINQRRCQGSEIREQKSRIAKFTLDIDQAMHNHMVVDNLGTTFAALSDPTRRAMIERLSHGPASVHGLTEPFALSQQMISKHIAYLVRARIVIKTKRGRESVCTLRPEAIKTVSAWAISYRRFWEESFDKLDVVVNQMKKEEVRDDGKHG
jgi:DNA-binding transcriptional ArsR family regulator